MAYVRSTSRFTSNGTTAEAAVVPKPSGLSNGDRLYAVIHVRRAVASLTWGSLPTGWVQVFAPVAHNPCHVAMYYKDISDAGSEPSTYTFTWTGGSRVESLCMRVDDLSGTHVSNTASGTSNGSSTSSVTAPAGSLVLQIHANDNAGGVVVAAPTGYRRISNNESGNGAASAELAISFKLQGSSSGATGSVSWGMTASEEWIGATVAISTQETANADTIPYTNTPHQFTRNTLTYSYTGETVNKNQIRFDSAKQFMPALYWNTLMATPGGTGELRGSGVDHDGTTPITVWYYSSANRYYFYRGTTLVRSWVTDDLMDGAYASTYRPTPGIFVYHGAIIVQCERKESGVIKGMAIVVSQDCGLTWSRVNDVSTGGDIPIITGDVSSGMERGHRWSTCGAFPYSEGTELTDVFVPVVDYLAKSSNPKGGQAGLFRMTRSGTGQWTVDNHRLLYERWEAGSSAVGTHLHTGGMCAEGMLLHLGDVDYRNEIILLSFDRTNYKTATVTPTVVFGGFSDTNTVYKKAPQPVAALPSPTFNRHIAAGDEAGPTVPEIWIESGSVKIKTLGNSIDNAVSATLWDSTTNLVGVYAGRKYIVYPFYSPDGVTWCRAPATRFYGTDHFIRINGSNVEVAPIPNVESVRPARISHGGDNKIDQFTQISAPHGDVTVSSVYYDGQFKYTSGDALLDPQPPAIPYFSGMILRQFSTAGGPNIGAYKLSTETINTTTDKFFTVMVFNMSEDVGISPAFSIGTVSFVDALRGQANSTNQQWMDFSEVCDPSSRNTEEARWQGFVGANSSNTYPDSSMLVAFIGLSEYGSSTYPIPPNTLIWQQPEKLTFTLASASSWTWNGVFNYPTRGFVTANSTERVFCTLYLDSDNHIQISIYNGTTVRAKVTKATVVTTHDITISTLVFDEDIDIIIECDGTDLVFHARGNGVGYGTATAAGKAISPIQSRISNHDQSIVQDIGVIGHFYWAGPVPASIVKYQTLSARKNHTFDEDSYVSDLDYGSSPSPFVKGILD